MSQKIRQWWQGFRSSGRDAGVMLWRCCRHEIHSLEGHAIALFERIHVARDAGSVSDLIYTQWDLVPESRRRLRRNAETRRALLSQFWLALRLALLGKTSSGVPA